MRTTFVGRYSTHKRSTEQEKDLDQRFALASRSLWSLPMEENQPKTKKKKKSSQSFRSTLKVTVSHTTSCQYFFPHTLLSHGIIRPEKGILEKKSCCWGDVNVIYWRARDAILCPQFRSFPFLDFLPRFCVLNEWQRLGTRSEGEGSEKGFAPVVGSICSWEVVHRKSTKDLS